MKNTRSESHQTKLIKLRIKSLVISNFTKEMNHCYEKSKSNKSPITEYERELLDLRDSYLEHYPHPKNCIFRISVYTRNILLALSDFIDNPDYCHNGGLKPLHFCKSLLRPLQKKQRIELVKVMTALMSAMSIETGFIGEYKRDETAILDESGNELLKGIKHTSIRDRYSIIWGRTISHTKYSDCIKMLKLAGFLEVESCYLSNDAGELLRHERRLQGASIEELEEIPRYKSVAAYKFFTTAFFQIFKAITSQDHMIEAKKKARVKRIKDKLSTCWVSYAPHSKFFFKKIRKALRDKLSQAFYKSDPIPISQTTH